MSEGFFSRWSRRKQEDAAAQANAEPVRPPALTPTPTPEAEHVPAPRATAEGQAPETPPLPSLEQAQALTPASDFQPFMQRGVGPEVRNVAMKKLFTDPHFNVMDGLDIYIDDYSQPDPMPEGMLRRMASAQFLKLVPEAAPDTPPTPQGVAQSPLPATKAPEHDHPDLQLQPDPAPSDPPAGSDPR